MRTRLLISLVGLGVAVAVAALALSLATGKRDRTTTGLVTIDVRHLHPGDVLTTQYSVSRMNTLHAPVFVVDVPKQGLLALLGRSTHLGCRVEWVGAPRYQRFEHAANVAFEDPCGGSLFALNGDCAGGPCPRGLDRFAVISTGNEVQINLDVVEPGPLRPTDRLS